MVYTNVTPLKASAEDNIAGYATGFGSEAGWLTILTRVTIQ